MSESQSANVRVVPRGRAQGTGDCALGGRAAPMPVYGNQCPKDMPMHCLKQPANARAVPQGRAQDAEGCALGGCPSSTPVRGVSSMSVKG